MFSDRVIVLLTVIVVAKCTCVRRDTEEIRARRFLIDINDELNRRRNIETQAEWDYASNITDETAEKKMNVSSQNAQFYKEMVQKLRKFDYENFVDEILKRQFQKLDKLGYAVLNENDFKELLGAISAMETNFAKVKICEFKNPNKCDLSLEPEIDEILRSSRNPEELKYYWKEFYDKAGTPTRKYFERYVELNRKSAHMNHFPSGAEVWLNEYEDKTIEEQLEKIFNQIRPLYMQLHAYVRYRLRQQYGNSVVSDKGPIPMHLLGNMWAQTWENIAPLVVPYPDKPLFDISQEMLRQNFTPIKMFEMGDKFFQSLNMTKLPKKFWEKSILEKPNDGRELICHASAWDFYKNDDVRIKMCTRVNMDQFFTVHHELGHIQYFLQYQHLPYVFREGANPGFHEAVGDVLSLSVSTPKHLNKVGLLADYSFDKETRINTLFLKALEKIIFMPFAFTLDKYRWAIFRGDIKSDEYNCAFWKLREEYSGIEPPVKRTEKDLDAPAKYHVSADVEYLRYLVSYIIQFQFYKSACIKAGQYVRGDPNLPLDNCDFYQSIEAGNAFKEMLSLGASKPWPEAMEIFTGQNKMSGNAIEEYFAPLHIWLVEENRKNNVNVGWTSSNKCDNERRAGF